MGPKTAVSEGDLFRHPLREQINLKHPLVRLADLINWAQLDASMSASFVPRKGRPIPAWNRTTGRGSLPVTWGRTELSVMDREKYARSASEACSSSTAT
jgi:hypothetical protein